MDQYATEKLRHWLVVFGLHRLKDEVWRCSSTVPEFSPDSAQFLTDILRSLPDPVCAIRAQLQDPGAADVDPLGKIAGDTVTTWAEEFFRSPGSWHLATSLARERRWVLWAPGKAQDTSYHVLTKEKITRRRNPFFPDHPIMLHRSQEATLARFLIESADATNPALAWEASISMLSDSASLPCPSISSFCDWLTSEPMAIANKTLRPSVYSWTKSILLTGSRQQQPTSKHGASPVDRQALDVSQIHSFLPFLDVNHAPLLALWLRRSGRIRKSCRGEGRLRHAAAAWFLNPFSPSGISDLLDQLWENSFPDAYAKVRAWSVEAFNDRLVLLHHQEQFISLLANHWLLGGGPIRVDVPRHWNPTLILGWLREALEHTLEKHLELLAPRLTDVSSPQGGVFEDSRFLTRLLEVLAELRIPLRIRTAKSVHDTPIDPMTLGGPIQDGD